MAERAGDRATVRPAEPGDAGDVVALEAAALGRDAWPPGLVLPAVSGEVPGLVPLVAPAAAGGLAGWAAVSVVDDVAELQRVAVQRSQRRSGVATALLDVAEDAARAGGAVRVLLEVRLENAAARALYEGRGYVEIGRRERYYRDGAPALVLEQPLGRMEP